MPASYRSWTRSFTWRMAGWRRMLLRSTTRWRPGIKSRGPEDRRQRTGLGTRRELLSSVFCPLILWNEVAHEHGQRIDGRTPAPHAPADAAASPAGASPWGSVVVPATVVAGPGPAYGQPH